MSMIPKGGDAIWGGLDWSPEDGYSPSKRKHAKNDTESSTQSESEIEATHANYGRIISFGRDAAEAPSSEIERIEFRVRFLVLVYSNNRIILLLLQVQIQ